MIIKILLKNSDIKRYIIISFALLVVSLKAISQDSAEVPLEKRSFFAKGRINGSVSYTFGRILDYQKKNDGSLDYENNLYRFKHSLALNVGLQLYKLVYLRTSFYYYLNPQINVPWVGPDYTYAIERVKWEAGSISYGYSNFGLNKFNSKLSEIAEKFLEGNFYLRYYNFFPSKWIEKLKLDNTTNLSYSLLFQYAIRYQDMRQNVSGNGKPILGASIRYTIIKDIFIEFSPLYYPVKSTKLDWDPDFTYAFGYNSYSHMTLGFQYGNYSVNRFPWSSNKVRNYNFLDGSSSIMLNFRW